VFYRIRGIGYIYNMKMYKFPPHPQHGTAFGIITVDKGTFVCPGWYPVDTGTTREQISFDVIDTPQLVRHQPVEPDDTWIVEGSKPGVVYQVSFKSGRWDCTCPSKVFHRGNCKHIKKIISEKSK
jgi:hypothetical protein